MFFFVFRKKRLLIAGETQSSSVDISSTLLAGHFRTTQLTSQLRTMLTVRSSDVSIGPQPAFALHICIFRTSAYFHRQLGLLYIVHPSVETDLLYMHQHTRPKSCKYQQNHVCRQLYWSLKAETLRHDIETENTSIYCVFSFIRFFLLFLSSRINILHLLVTNNQLQYHFCTHVQVVHCITEFASLYHVRRLT